MPVDRYAVMGNPIAHSKSPRIHAAFAAQTGQALAYEAILVPLGGFQDALESFASGGGRGLNITVPFKQEAWAAVDSRSPRAERARAVNTIVLGGEGRRYGDNTDGVGLVRDLTVNHGAVLAGRRLLLLGAGGAARGVLGPLLEERPASLLIANRTARRAEELAADHGDLGPVSGGGFDVLAEEEGFDLVINATAASLQGAVPPLPGHCLAPGAWCYDLMYAAEPTAFLTWAEAHGAERAIDGLGMLVEQAAESFALWRGVRPDTAPVIRMLRGG
ncbi:MAG: shikimate dehydrogenase [Gammaproteobacteria bacterium]|nr:shikimate dehydrogenase [Gammaproteobacteria bacterium]